MPPVIMAFEPVSFFPDYGHEGGGEEMSKRIETTENWRHEKRSAPTSVDKDKPWREKSAPNDPCVIHSLKWPPVSKHGCQKN